MRNADLLRQWFGSGRLLLPDDSSPTSVHLARALARLNGVREVRFQEHERRLAEAIGEADHFVFLLVDGLGMNLIEALPGRSFLRRHLRMTLRSVFPSSTAPGITSLATGLWPAEHGVPSWFIYLREADVTAISLPFIDRFSRRSLEGEGVRPEWLYSAAPLIGSYRRDAELIMPASVADSVYTRYIAGRRPIHPRGALAGAVDAVLERLQAAPGQTFTYVYHAAVDAAQHDRGPESAQTAAAVREVERELTRLRDESGPQVRIIVTADHGLFLVPERDRLTMGPEDELLELLVCPPTGEGRLPIFHVLEGRGEDFRDAFERRYKGRFLLLDRQDVDDLRLFGPAPVSPQTRERTGDFMALPMADETLVYAPSTPMAGHHGGLSPAEVAVPLIVA
jgi:hypothetical protein